MIAAPAGSRRDALAPAIVLFAILVAHTLLETARDALFLARLGPEKLAWVYLAMAAIALAAFGAVRQWAGLRDPRRVLIAFLGAATIGTAGFAIAIASSRATVFAFYVWTGLIATLIVPAFWTLLDRSLRVGQAKEAFAFIGAGGVLGAIVGSLLAGGLGRLVAATYLVPAGACAYAGALVCAIALAPRRRLEEPRRRPRRVEKRSQAAHRYVVLLVGFGIVSTIALTLGDLLFKRVVAHRFAPDELASVFGAIYAGLNALALVIQLLVTRRLLAKWGVGAALVVLPAMLASTAFGFALSGALVAVLVLKLGDGGLRHSLHRTSSELLYLPVPTSVRDGWKPIADGIVLRGGEALAALIAFGAGVAGFDARVLAAIAGAAAIAWLIGVPIAHRAYLAQFRDTLRAGETERDVRTPAIDGDTAELLVEALASPNEEEALAALDLLAGRVRLPSLVLYHPCAAVVRRALPWLERDSRGEVAGALEHLLAHPDLAVRASALATTCGSGRYRAQRIVALDDPDPRMRAAALVGLASDPEHGDLVVARIAAMVTASTAERAGLAYALGHAPDLRLRDRLYELLAWREPDVVREVVGILAHDPAHADLGRLIGLLALPEVRGDVRAVFLAAGTRGLDRLLAALEDPRTPLAVRQHLPRTISRFGTRRAAAALVARLARETDGTTVHKLLRVLGRMRAEDPSLRIDKAAIRAFAARSVADAARYATLGDALASVPRQDTALSVLIAELLHDECTGAVEHAFRALGILRPRAGLRSVHEAMIASDDARRSAAREILQARSPAGVSDPLVALLERGTGEERRARLGGLAVGPFASYEELVDVLVADPSESVRGLATYQRRERAHAER